MKLKEVICEAYKIAETKGLIVKQIDFIFKYSFDRNTNSNSSIPETIELTCFYEGEPASPNNFTATNYAFHCQYGAEALLAIFAIECERVILNEEVAVRSDKTIPDFIEI